LGAVCVFGGLGTVLTGLLCIAGLYADRFKSAAPVWAKWLLWHDGPFVLTATGCSAIGAVAWIASWRKRLPGPQDFWSFAIAVAPNILIGAWILYRQWFC
jgi:hypothetical protein